MVKGLGAGTVNTVLALAAGETLPGPWTIGFGMALGAVSYGTSLALFILAMRDLGARADRRLLRHRAVLSAPPAPFCCSASRPPRRLLVAAGLMALATWLLVGERHAHTHRHAATVHAHVHVTDAHHQHEHSRPGRRGAPQPSAFDGPAGARAPHTPDAHHDHGHA